MSAIISVRTLSLSLILVASAACGIDALGTKIDADAGLVLEATGGDAAAADAGPTDAGDGGGDASPPPPLCTQDDSSLIACFAFEGAANDDSPARTAVPTTATNLAFEPGREGQALRLTLAPKSDLRLPPTSLNTAQMSVDLWVRLASLPPGGGRAMIFDQNGRLGIIVAPDGNVTCGGVGFVKKLAPNQWTHLACVLDGTQVSLYVGGELQITMPGAALATTADFVGVGEDSPSAGDNLDGWLDNFRVWSRALTPAEIASAASR